MSFSGCLTHNTDGVHNNPCQDMTPWYTKYFKLKMTSEISQAERTLWLSPEGGHKTLMGEGPSPCWEERNLLISKVEGCWNHIFPHVPPLARTLVILSHFSMTFYSLSNLVWTHSGLTAFSSLYFFLIKVLMSCKCYIKYSWRLRGEVQQRRNVIWHPLYAESKKKWYEWTYL